MSNEPRALEQPPELDIDALFLSRFGKKVRPEGRLERRIVWNLIKHLKTHGFEVVGLHDGEELHRVTDAKSAMELIFDLDDAWLHVKKIGHRPCWVRLIMGNGIDIVSDWGVHEPSGFHAAMESFNAEDYA